VQVGGRHEDHRPAGIVPPVEAPTVPPDGAAPRRATRRRTPGPLSRPARRMEGPPCPPPLAGSRWAPAGGPPCRSRRSRVSCGDSARPSASAAAVRVRRQSRPDANSAAARSSSRKTSPGCRNRSSATTASSSGRIRARSSGAERSRHGNASASGDLLGREAGSTDADAGHRAGARRGRGRAFDVVLGAGELDAPERGGGAPGCDGARYQERCHRLGPQLVRHLEGRAGVDVGEQASPGRAVQLVTGQPTGAHRPGAAEDGADQARRYATERGAPCTPADRTS
jgi:hypothetical protein